ncbi:MAG: MFS transporter [Oscillibacter sp.]|nr:MFS transporter [Oscillibacter sp.]
MRIWNDEKVKNAVLIGTLCSVLYLCVYFARNILGAVTPQILEEGQFSTEYIGSLSSWFFAFYAVGQLVNGIIGDRVKARNMLSAGLLLSGVCSLLMPTLLPWQLPTSAVYGMTGYFLAMIYAPMTKTVAENTEPLYATRCSLGYTLASFLGSPLAGVTAAVFAWQTAFYISGAALVAMAITCFAGFLWFEKRGIVTYGRYTRKEKQSGSIRVLLERQIVKFTLVSIVTGVIRTSVVFWIPTYVSQYLGFSPKASASIYTVSTLAISSAAFIAAFLYERLRRNMNLTLLVAFGASALSFLLVYLVPQPVCNIAGLVLAITMANCASTMLWSWYCPSLRDTGMVSSATGFLDFVSYMAAAVSSTLFAGASTTIGWKNLILIWFILMAFGTAICVRDGLRKKEGEMV